MLVNKVHHYCVIPEDVELARMEISREKVVENEILMPI